MTRKTFGIALCALGLAAQGAVNWDDALIFGRVHPRVGPARRSERLDREMRCGAEELVIGS